MKLKKIIKYLLIIIPAFIFFTNSFSSDKLCGNNLLTYLEKNTPDTKYFHYNEMRNDSGIFFDFDWDKKQKKIIIRRNNNNYPIIRFSLFDNKNADKTVNENVLKTIIKNDEEFIDLINQIDMTLCDALTIENLSYKLNTILKNRIEIIG